MNYAKLLKLAHAKARKEKLSDKALAAKIHKAPTYLSKLFRKVREKEEIHLSATSAFLIGMYLDERPKK